MSDLPTEVIYRNKFKTKLPNHVFFYVFFILSLTSNELHILQVGSPFLNDTGMHVFIQTVLSSVSNFVFYFIVKSFLMLPTWGEDVWVEADVKGRVADGADSLAGIQDHLAAFRI